MGTREWRKEPKECMRVETKKFLDWVSTLPNLFSASFPCPHSLVKCLLLSFCPSSCFHRVEDRFGLSWPERSSAMVLHSHYFAYLGCYFANPLAPSLLRFLFPCPPFPCLIPGFLPAASPRWALCASVAIPSSFFFRSLSRFSRLPALGSLFSSSSLAVQPVLVLPMSFFFSSR